MSESTFKEKVEKNLTIWLLGVLLTGFLSGIATYKAILEIAQLETISKSKLQELTSKTSKITNPEHLPIEGASVVIAYTEEHMGDAVLVQERLIEAKAEVTLRRQNDIPENRKAAIYYREPRDLKLANWIQRKILDVQSVEVRPYSSRKKEFAIAIWLK